MGQLKKLYIDLERYQKQLKFYNSITRKKESFLPINPPQVKLYTCGPTVYDFAHIGNLRTFIFEDLLVRVLDLVGYKPTQVMNITDVDDKTIKKATHAKLSLQKYTQIYTQAFFDDLQLLKVRPAKYYPRATDHIPQMIEMIETLMKKGYAYCGVDQSIYFSIRKFQAYGRLAQLQTVSDDTEENRGGSIEDEYEKDEVQDFVLWKSYDPQRDADVYWESPFGRGRPGWHIECSAMAHALLGQTIDIHTGGVDNLFPHHENEIAQSECCWGKEFAHTWLHAQHLMVEGKKMAKREGNFYTLRDLLEKNIEPLSIRFLLMQAHYRHGLNFTFDGLNSASLSIQRLQDGYYRYKNVSKDLEDCPDTQIFNEQLQEALDKFILSLCDDLNISAALACVFDALRLMHSFLDRLGSWSLSTYNAMGDFFNVVNTILSCFEEEQSFPQDVLDLFQERVLARKEKDFSLADALREKILKAGYTIEDGPQGARLKRLVRD